jgi:hypothetical protein
MKVQEICTLKGKHVAHHTSISEDMKNGAYWEGLNSTFTIKQ